MEIKLSKSIAELEENIKFIWQPPDIYDDVHNNYIWHLCTKCDAQNAMSKNTLL